jgi:alpha,alpha-trehalase
VNDWVLTYEGFDPEAEGTRETLCTLGNGYFATRGAVPESVADDVHYPGTYIAGVYNRLATELSGRLVESESMVNAPNWLPVTFRVRHGAWFDAAGTEVLSHQHDLDMYRGVLTRRTRFRDPSGRILGVTQRRFVSMRDPHFAGLETSLVAENWAGTLEVQTALDGTVRNSGVHRYNSLDNVHLAPVSGRQEDDEVICLVTETNQSHVRIAEAARTRLFHNGRRIGLNPAPVARPGYIALTYEVDLEAGDELTVEKVVALFTSRDMGITEPEEKACDWAKNVAGDFDELLERHMVSWRHLWHRARVEVGADSTLAQALHLQLFQLMQTLSNNSVGLDVGVPARGLHGEAYRGHVFWDEMFIIPLFSMWFPQLARAVLLYRYRRIEEARRAATAAGYTGAMFPWQSASDGREQTQTMHLNPASGHWLPDASHLQRHVNAAIVFNVWHYYLATHDLEFLRFFGAEMIFEIARFWASAATYNDTLDRYEINGVMGPDEYHEAYLDRDEPGLDNNTYTNLMAVWCLCRALDVLEQLPPDSVQDLKERLGITDHELDQWDQVSRKMRVCFLGDGVMSQFEGYELLDELDWDAYRRKYGNIGRLDRILEAEGDTPNRYRLAKQADVTMLFYVLSASDLAELLERLGYGYDERLIPRNIAYYEPRTAHGSTLSRVVHSWIHARGDRSQSWQFFCRALYSDLADLQDGTTKEGIHLGAMAGAVDILYRCYPGIELIDNVLRLHPLLPAELGSLAYSISYRGQLVHLEFTTDMARIGVAPGEGEPITVDVDGTTASVAPGQTIDVPLDSLASGAVSTPS